MKSPFSHIICFDHVLFTFCLWVFFSIFLSYPSLSLFVLLLPTPLHDKDRQEESCIPFWMISFIMVIFASFCFPVNEINSLWLNKSHCVPMNMCAYCTYLCVYVCTPHFLIHSSADGHLGWFQVLDIVTRTTIDVGLQVSLSYSDILASGSIFSYLKKTPLLFSKVVTLIFLPVRSCNLTFSGEFLANACSPRWSTKQIKTRVSPKSNWKKQNVDWGYLQNYEWRIICRFIDSSREAASPKYIPQCERSLQDIQAVRKVEDSHSLRNSSVCVNIGRCYMSLVSFIFQRF